MGVELRVIYGDTDQMGVVYYANYLRFFEAARGAFLRERGMKYGEVEAGGYVFPVIDAQVRYVRPLKFDDVFHVEATMLELKRASMRFAYRLTRGEELCADGSTGHACMKNGRPVRFTDEMLHVLQRS
jgi:acyl-CoA thioester hydrolase